jgi:hypothetical protein
MDPELKNGLKSLLAKSPKQIFFGVIVVIFSLNGVLKLIAQKNPVSSISYSLYQASQVPNYLYNQVPGGQHFLFALLIHWLLISLLVFFVLLAITSLRHGSFSFLFSGTIGFVGGLSALTLITLIFYAIYWLIVFFSWVVSTVQSVILYLLSWILWPPSLIILGTLLAAGLLYAIIKNRDAIFKAIRELLQFFLSSLPKILVFVGLLAVTVGIIWFVGSLIYPFVLAVIAFIQEYIAPLIAWVLAVIITLVLFLLAIGFILAVVWALGELLLEQFSAAQFCGRSTHEAFDSCFGVGATLSLILLVCAAKPEYHEILRFIWAETSYVLPQVDPVIFAYALMPQEAYEGLQQGLQWSSIPIFDTLNVVICLVLMNASLLMGMLSGIIIKPLGDLIAVERAPASIKLFGGLLFALLVVLTDSSASSE